MDRMVKVCPICGDIRDEKDLSKTISDVCGGDCEGRLVDTDLPQGQYKAMGSIWYGIKGQIPSLRQFMREKYVLPLGQYKYGNKSWDGIEFEPNLDWSQFETTLEEQEEVASNMLWRQAQLEKALPPPPTPQVKCPYCNSTQIQMVPRKWSLLTGFLTNKVDRVCMNCKRKF